MLSSPSSSVTITRVCVALSPRSAQNLMHSHCGIHCEIAPGQIHNFKQKDVKITMLTQLRDTLYTNFQNLQSSKPLATVLHCLPPDDDRMIETCCGINIGRRRIVALDGPIIALLIMYG
jgi:hypothetical protein